MRSAELIDIQDLTWLTNRQADQLSSADSCSNLPVIAGYLTRLASFSMQCVQGCVYYLPFHVFLQARHSKQCFPASQALKTIHYFLTCRPGTQNNSLFLNIKPNSTKKNRLYTSNGSGRGNIVNFDNIQIQTPSHPYISLAVVAGEVDVTEIDRVIAQLR